jgi:rhamnogalacturonan endolyase
VQHHRRRVLDRALPGPLLDGGRLGLGNKPGPDNFLIYRDTDESRELEDATSITKFGGGTLLSCSDCASNDGTKATPTLTADLLDDWREEVV